MARYDYNIKKINYVRKPFARRSILCVLTFLAAAALCALSLYLSVRTGGQGGLNAAACGFSSILFTLACLGYGGLSFLEEEKNYILAKIGICAGIILLMFWIFTIAAGIFGPPVS